MSVTNVATDRETLSLTLTAEFDVSVERAWQLWADPRQLERWWGPPMFPATVQAHEFAANGQVTYFMTGPDNDRHHGWWRIVAVDAPRRLEFEDGFADTAGTPNPDMPVTAVVVTLGDRPGGGTVMTVSSRFASAEQMEQLLTMQMDEGMTQAMNQMDAILAA